MHPPSRCSLEPDGLFHIPCPWFQLSWLKGYLYHTSLKGTKRIQNLQWFRANHALYWMGHTTKTWCVPAAAPKRCCWTSGTIQPHPDLSQKYYCTTRRIILGRIRFLGPWPSNFLGLCLIFLTLDPAALRTKNMDLRTKVIVPEGTSYIPEDMAM